MQSTFSVFKKTILDELTEPIAVAIAGFIIYWLLWMGIPHAKIIRVTDKIMQRLNLRAMFAAGVIAFVCGLSVCWLGMFSSLELADLFRILGFVSFVVVAFVITIYTITEDKDEV